MTPRKPTTHELKIWRESNRFTVKKRPETEAEEFHTEDGIAHSSPCRGEARRGPEQGTNSARLRPHPNPPPTGERTLYALPSRMAKRAFAQYGAVDATLDMHGLTKLDAYARVQHFIRAQYKKGHRHLRIITGKGRLGEGILRTELPHWLNEPSLRPLISAFTTAKPEKGGNGVTHVLVKKHRD